MFVCFDWFNINRQIEFDVLQLYTLHIIHNNLFICTVYLLRKFCFTACYSIKFAATAVVVAVVVISFLTQKSITYTTTKISLLSQTANCLFCNFIRFQAIEMWPFYICIILIDTGAQWQQQQPRKNRRWRRREIHIYNFDHLKKKKKNYTSERNHRT